MTSSFICVVSSQPNLFICITDESSIRFFVCLHEFVFLLSLFVVVVVFWALDIMRMVMVIYTIIIIVYLFVS